MRMLPESDLFHREDLSLHGTGEDMPLFYPKGGICGLLRKNDR